MSQARTVSTSENEIFRAVEDRYAGADEARADHLAGLEILLEARSGMLERESRRLTKKYAAGHARVAFVVDLLAANTSLLQFVRDELARDVVKPPEPERDAWIVFGRVRRPDGRPLVGANVVLCDTHGKLVNEAEPSTTGRHGDYRVLFPMPKPPEDAADGKPPVVHLEVFRAKRHLIADTAAFNPNPGKVVHRDIDLTAGA